MNCIVKKAKKNKINAVVCVITLFVMIMFALQCKTYAVESGSSNEQYNKIDDYLLSCSQDAHIPAMTVTIVNKDQVLFSKNYGQVENCDTPFVLGSVSKSFTAVCIMQLVEQGMIDLNDTISKYLPDATDGDRITVSQLLNHTGGLGEYQTLANYKIINEQGVHNYANVNYSLLGKIIEEVSGMPYEDYITKNIFEPLSLSNTAATLDKSIKNGLIDGYTNYWGLHLKRDHKYPESDDAWITVPAGYISSSANDLGRYLQMYLNGGEGTISQQSIDTIFYGDTVFVDGDVPFWYGYGWAEIKEPLPEPVLRHSGLVETGTSCIFIIPESGIGIAITANVNDYFVTNEMMDSLGWGVVLMLLGEQPNEISENAYWLSHLQIDLIMFAVFVIAVILLCLIPSYRKRIQRNKPVRSFIWLGIAHLLAPILILLIVPVIFKTPLWVAKSFVPDVYITVVVSAVYSFFGGAVKTALLWRLIKDGSIKVE
ncbi:MAG: beta-lactamase family protein [Lachnospiraceae bacterium]|nr:beta-lactamase family protein [Lachnospiraceae bacterium]